MKFQPLLSLVLLAAFGPALTGCASNQALRASLQDRDALIRDLRAENQAVKERIQAVTYDRDQLQVALNDRALDPIPLPAEASADRAPGAKASDPKIDTTGFEGMGISLERYGDTVVFGIPASATFASGSATLSHEGEAALNAVITQLKTAFPATSTFYIEGHTDSERIKRSKFSSNRDLSYHRARAVHEYLVTNGRIDDARFVVVAYGPHKPKDTNDTAEGRAHNRRVEIVVRKG
ncbi:MAG: OmpA family protein [Planctomycetes bacterium]|nr:OmpA family protein [Planctomycetota bacterium]MCB9910629.1 OmpA family protein [Planctomycetota bacterium]HPF13490.1 OmpA family protein [Planctomycetota bacterium]HRV80717.1 OmpA family protein [Planctomycetota bacterium]